MNWAHVACWFPLFLALHSRALPWLLSVSFHSHEAILCQDACLQTRVTHRAVTSQRLLGADVEKAQLRPALGGEKSRCTHFQGPSRIRRLSPAVRAARTMQPLLVSSGDQNQTPRMVADTVDTVPQFWRKTTTKMPSAWLSREGGLPACPQVALPLCVERERERDREGERERQEREISVVSLCLGHQSY